MTLPDYLVNEVDYTLVLVGVVILLIASWFLQSNDYPPGPIGLPIVGYLPFMTGVTPEKSLAKICQKYGNVARSMCWGTLKISHSTEIIQEITNFKSRSFCMGSLRVTVLGNYAAVKEALVKQGDNFAGKPQEPHFKFKEGDTGLTTMEGETWKEQRRFILATFRDFGMGKLSLEPKIVEEIRCCLNELAKHNGEPLDIGPLIGTSVANVIAAMEFGTRFEHNDPEFIKLRENIAAGSKLISAVGIRVLFPWTRFIPFFNMLTQGTTYKKIVEEYEIFLKGKIAAHEAVYEEGSRKDFIDAYLSERNFVIKRDGIEGNYTLNSLEGTMAAMFAAGSETTNTIIRWALLYLMKHPDVMKKVQKEIDDVIGLERTPSLVDKPKLIYTEATMMEVLRCASTAPLTLVHSNMEDATVLGHRIPKRSYVVCNLWAINNDPELWGDPEVFRPDRFLDEEGKLLRPEYFIPFGAGKRNCIGESLGRMELFLYFTSTLQRFDFSMPEGEAISFEYEFGITRTPKPYKICCIQRKDFHVI